MHVTQCASEVSPLLLMCEQLRETMIVDLTEISNKATALEWIVTFLDPLKNWLEQVQKDTAMLLTQDEWPRRPQFENSR